MVFNSFSFFIFFIAFIFFYFIVPGKFRLLCTLFGSIIFYYFFSWKGLLIFSGEIIFNYFNALAIKKYKKKEFILGLSIAVNIGALFLFKYFDFFNSSLSSALHFTGLNNPVPLLHLLVPVGISFYTLQAISYNVDIYNEIQEPEKNFAVFATYFFFFPKITQGPVERPRNLLPQLHKKKEFDYKRVTSGLKLIAWGLFKKVVIADRLAVIVSQVYDNPNDYTGLPLFVAGLFYTIQLYADFSGYTDMALGISEIMGFKLMKNFTSPFAATSVTDFWKRWHISFSTWLYEYIYNPISLMKRNWGKWGMVFAIMVTFSVSGLWHGVGWTFILWGVLNGIVLSYEVLTVKARKKFWKNFSSEGRNLFCTIITLLFTILSFTFARANNLSDAGYFFTHLFDASKSVSLLTLGLNTVNFFIAISAIVLMEVIQYYQRRGSVREIISSQPWFIRWAIYCFGILTILNLGMFGGGNFIYIQF